MKNLTQLPGSGKCSKAKNDNTLGRMRGGIRSKIGSMSLKNTSLFGVILTLLLTFGVGEMRAAGGTETNITVYYSIPPATVGSYSVRVNANIGDGGTWRQNTMSFIGTYDGTSNIYQGNAVEKYGGVDALQFQLYDGNTWKSQVQPISSWTTTGTYSGKMWTNGGSSWGTAPSNLDYYVAGGNDWLSADWDTKADRMTNNHDGTHTITISSVTVAAHNFKLTGGAWGLREVGYSTNVSCVNGTVENNSGNIQFTPYVEGDVTITYNGTNVVITCTAPTVTFDKEGGSGGTSSQSTPYGSSTTSITAPTKTGYDFGGYYDGDNGTGNQVINASGVWQKNKTNFTNNDATCKWIVTSNRTLYAKWTAKTYTITIDKNGGSADGSVKTTYNSSSTTNLTEPTRSGYHVTGYYSASSDGTLVMNTSGTLQASVSGFTGAGGIWTATTSPKLYAYWEADAVISLTVNAGTHVSTVTGSTSPVTLGNSYAITASNFDTGYEFYNWTASPAANATFTSSTSASTNVTVKNGSVTVTANAQEIMSTITTSNSYDVGDPSYAAPTVYGSATTVGYTTTREITAASASTGYTFAGWTLTNCTRTDGGGATANPITVRSNGDGAAATVVANYNEDLSTPYTIKGGTNITGNNWTTAYNLTKKTGHSTESVAYYTFNISSTNSGVSGEAGDWSFKVIKDGSTWYGLDASGSYWWQRSTDANQTLGSGEENIQICADVAGPYEIKLDYSTPASPTVTVTFPTSYTLNYSVGSVAGNNGNISTSPSTTSGSKVLSGTTITLTAPAAKTGYTWKGWYTDDAGTTGKINDTDRAISVTMNADKTLYACYNENSYNATVSAGTGGSVLPNGTVAIKQATGTSLTATALAGYKFSNWTISGGGITPTSSSTSPQTFKATTTGGTIQANFARTYAFIEGRFHITNADRDGTWTNTFAEGDWDDSSIQIPFAYDNTNHLFYLRTYATPKELSTNISDLRPYFFIKLGSSSSSVSDAVTYRPYTSGTTYQELSAAGDENKKQAITPGNSSHSYWFNSSDESGYVKLYFNQSHIWYWLEQTLEYDANGGTGDAPAAKTYYDKGTNATAASNTFTRDGYTFNGWKTAPSSGTSYSAGASVTMNSNITLYAQWTARTYTITLDQQTSATGYSASGTASVPTVTYNAVLPAIEGTMPTTTGYYGFMGFYTEENGEGERLTDGTGAWIASVDGYTDADKKWIYPGNVTLYAYYRTATIGSISLGGETAFAQNTSVTATATIEPTPVSTTVVCWRLLHYNDNPVDPQPTFTPAFGTSVSFNTPEASGMYKIEATLRTGSTCGSGDELGSNTQSFQVAGEHTVSIQYMCGDVTLKEPVSMTGRPLSWSDEITAPEIFGYTFTRWTAGDGVTIKDSENEDVTSSSEETIKIKATYDARLTAEYTQKSLIFFKNTLNWGSVYVNFYTGSYWSNPKGSGNENVTNRNKEMTQIGETDVWYFDYGEEDITPSSYVSFTDAVQDNYKEFWGGSPGVNVVYPANYADDIHTDKSSETGFKPATPMFVPLASQEPVTLNEGGGGWANYYNSGYWTQYTAGTGYTLEVYNSEGNVLQKSMTFTSADDLMPMSATVDLEGGITYKFQIRRGGTGDNGVYYGNGGEMTYTNHGQDVAWDLSNSSFSMCRLTTNASGDYTFNLSYSGHATVNPHYRLRMAVDYPIASGDYRLVYTDSKPTCKPSAIVPLVNNGKDTISFFVRKESSPSLRIQKATVANDGTITWAEYPTAGTPTNQITSSIASAITKDSVYNFCLEMNGSGALSVAKAEPYTGSYYIRVDCANSKWDNYRSDRDHLMTYSEYSDKKAGYSHYYTHWVDCSESGRKSVKFCIANDYSPCISDTLTREVNTGTWANINNYITEGGDLKRNANVRFMWNRHDNSVSRAYIDGAQEDGSHFLQILSADSKIKNAAGDAVLTEVTFSDKGNWLYEAMIKAQTNAQIKLKSIWGTTNTIEQYFKGSSDATATLIGGTSSDWYDIRLIYDFKTNRLVTAYLPSGTLSEDLEIHADIMFLREHQGDVTQIDFTGGAKITDIETVYSVLQFNMWTLNNRSKSSGHALLNPLLSRYERDLFYVSFPYDVKLSDVIGFGTYGKHWIIEYYDGAERAKKGFWADSPSFWKFVTPAMKNSFTLKAGTGYIVALDLDELWWKANDDKSDVWKNTEVAELLFPGNVASISSTTVTYNMPEHTCTIGPRFDGGEDRTIKDSHWNVLGVPTYHNLDDGVGVSAANTTWTAAHPKYIYTWNMQDNTLTATSATGFDYQAMHAYVVQYCGNITFTTSASPAPVVARRTQGAAKEIEFRLALQQNNADVDQTFVRMSNDEEVSAGFEFGEDMSKEFNKSKSNIYTMITSTLENETSVTEAAGNVLPMTEQTTVVPVGVKIAANSDYTFSIPEGTEGIGVTLIDKERGIRTNLSAVDYTVSLEEGTYNERFVIEISPIHNMPTELETSDIGDQKSDVRKLLIDGLLYIVRDGKIYDARGARIE